MTDAPNDRLAEKNRALEARVKQLEAAKREADRVLQEFGGADRIRADVLSARKFEQAVEASSDAVSMLLPTLEYIYVNPAWQKMTGYTAEEALGNTPDMLDTGQGDLKFLVDLNTAAKQGKILRHEMMLHRKNGEEYAAELAMYPVRDAAQNEPLFHVIFHNDITQRKKVEAAQTAFVSLASHQLRTPLTAIRWIFNTLITGKPGPLTALQRELVQDGQESVVRMAETIGTMLVISQIEAGKMRLTETSVRLAELLSEVAGEQKISYIEKQQVFSLECQDDLVLSIDRKFLKEAVANLVSNAVKYTPPGKRITVRAGKEPSGDMHIDVTDEGCGIPAGQRDRIFTKFFRADNVMRETPEGTGLGLYLVRQLITMMGGSVTFTSEEGKGTTFSIHVPANPHV